MKVQQSSRVAEVHLKTAPVLWVPGVNPAGGEGAATGGRGCWQLLTTPTVSREDGSNIS